jgi:hypothetical protein
VHLRRRSHRHRREIIPARRRAVQDLKEEACREKS